jgi:hypothetical protein
MIDDEPSKRLQQLLRLKRHETPPPGYFNEFSDTVLDRIRTLESERAIPKWRRWFSRGSQSSHGQISESDFWPVWGRNTAIGLSMLVAVVGGLYWASRLTDPEGMSSNPPLQAASLGNPSAVAPAASTVGPGQAVGTGLAARSMFELVEPRSVQFHPVTVSMSGFSPELSSTNPLPLGLFRLPGASGGGSDAYRVRFGNNPR